jgi:hypothetical protein
MAAEGLGRHINHGCLTLRDLEQELVPQNHVLQKETHLQTGKKFEKFTDFLWNFNPPPPRRRAPVLGLGVGIFGGPV